VHHRVLACGRNIIGDVKLCPLFIFKLHFIKFCHPIRVKKLFSLKINNTNYLLSMNQNLSVASVIKKFKDSFKFENRENVNKSSLGVFGAKLQ